MYRISLTNKFTCVDLEQELELERGAITAVTVHSNGKVDVCFDKEPATLTKDNLKSLLNMKITSEGAE